MQPRDGGSDVQLGARGCLTGTVRPTPSLTCDLRDTTLDGAGLLCIRVYAIHAAPPPNAPIGARCISDVRLCGASSPWPYLVHFDLDKAPPGDWIWVEAFLAESADAAAPPPTRPLPGDLWLSRPVAVPTADECVTLPIVLDARYAR